MAITGYRTFKRKLILNQNQERRIISWIGVCRLVYNMGIDINKSAYLTKGKYLNAYNLSKDVTAVKKEYEWIRDVPAMSLQAVLERLDRSYKNFFTQYKPNTGYPKYANKKKYRSIQFKQSCNIIRVDGNKLNLHKLGTVKMFSDSPIAGKIINVHVKLEPTGFFAYIECENVPRKFVSDNQAIGLDMGLSHFCIDSNGNFIANPRHFKRYEKKLRVEQRSLDRKKMGSNSWKRQAKKVAGIHHKIVNIRKDFLQKESTKIAKANSIVYIEDLNINSMRRNRRLAKHILDCGWGLFRDMLEYKTTVVRVAPNQTSQTCFECGEVDANSRVSQSEFVCTSCGFVSNADINAAKNIMSKGIALSRQRESLDCA